MMAIRHARAQRRKAIRTLATHAAHTLRSTSVVIVFI